LGATKQYEAYEDKELGTIRTCMGTTQLKTADPMDDKRPQLTVPASSALKAATT
jgi:hypothetical protein